MKNHGKKNILSKGILIIIIKIEIIIIFKKSASKILELILVEVSAMDRTNNTVAIESEYIAIDNVNNSISNYLGNYMPKWMPDSA